MEENRLARLPSNVLHELFGLLDLFGCVRLCAAWPPAYRALRLFVRSVGALTVPTTCEARQLGLVAASGDRLASLDLSHCPRLDDVGPLRACVALERLYLQGCEAVTDVAPLAACTALTHLDLGRTGVRDLAPLGACCRRLAHLFLHACPDVSDLGPLAGCPRLRTLEAPRCFKLCDLSPLGACAHLRFLDVSDDYLIGDIVGPVVARLDRLSASGTRVRIVAAEPCPAFVDLSYTRQSDLRALAGSGELDVSYTAVSDLAPLARSTTLRRLDLSGCPVSDLAALASCGTLTHLRLRNCKDVRDLRPLLACPALATVEAEGCTKLTRGEWDAFVRAFV